MRKRAVCLAGVLSPLVAFAGAPAESVLSRWEIASRGPVIWFALGVAVAGREWLSRWRGNAPWAWLAQSAGKRDQGD